MTVRIRKYRTGGFEVDIRFMYPDGETYRQRLRAPMESKSAAKRWGEQREAGHLTLSTTLRYMHLSPAARESAIRLLDQPLTAHVGVTDRGDILETAVR